ncbi:hypothetical protein T492DRAFT_831829 [Pavlovales sp. CCMP2436]|nr:hypothetical protein T492DRAFT_831829 [Pavlovales sp. CCMP2436]
MTDSSEDSDTAMAARTLAEMCYASPTMMTRRGGLPLHERMQPLPPSDCDFGFGFGSPVAQQRPLAPAQPLTDAPPWPVAQQRPLAPARPPTDVPPWPVRGRMPIVQPSPYASAQPYNTQPPPYAYAYAQPSQFQAQAVQAQVAQARAQAALAQVVQGQAALARAWAQAQAQTQTQAQAQAYMYAQHAQHACAHVQSGQQLPATYIYVQLPAKAAVGHKRKERCILAAPSCTASSLHGKVERIKLAAGRAQPQLPQVQVQVQVQLTLTPRVAHGSASHSAGAIQPADLPLPAVAGAAANDDAQNALMSVLKIRLQGMIKTQKSKAQVITPSKTPPVSPLTLSAPWAAYIPTSQPPSPCAAKSVRSPVGSVAHSSYDSWKSSNAIAVPAQLDNIPIVHLDQRRMSR